MKTLADIKRAMTIGSKWHTIHHGYAPDWTPLDMGIREVVERRTNQVGFRTAKGSVSWIEFPKLSCIIFHGENSFSIIDREFGLKPLLTYKLIH